MEIIVKRLKSDELYHHGVKGQNWGERHGPPYPLDPNSSKQAKRKQKATIKEVEKRKKTRRELNKRIEAGDIGFVKNNKQYMTNDELKKAFERFDLMQKISEIDTKHDQNSLKTTNEFLKMMRNVLAIPTAAVAVTKLKFKK